MTKYVKLNFSDNGLKIFCSIIAFVSHFSVKSTQVDNKHINFKTWFVADMTGSIIVTSVIWNNKYQSHVNSFFSANGLVTLLRMWHLVAQLPNLFSLLALCSDQQKIDIFLSVTFFLQKLAPALWQIGRIFLQQLFGNQNVFEIYNCEAT